MEGMPRVSQKTWSGKAQETIAVDGSVRSKDTKRSSIITHPSRLTVLPATRVVEEVLATIVPKYASIV